MSRFFRYIICFFIGVSLWSCSKDPMLGFDSKNDLVRWYNYQLPAFLELNKCNPSCMYELKSSDSEELICWKINHNFREDVVHVGMEPELFKKEVEAYYKIPIRRFSDAKFNPDLPGSGEPSSLVSDDGNKIELFCTNGMYYESEDGVNWTKGERLVMSDGKVPSHFSVNKIDGVYYMTGYVSRAEGKYMDIYVSTDRIHFTYKGHLVSDNTDLGNGLRFDNFGNSYLLKTEEGVYYFYYEGAANKSNWEICLMTCDDIFSDGGSGFIGNWRQCQENPILAYSERDIAGETPHAYCNPEIIKGEDNQPLVVDGKYYMYYLSGFYKGNVLYATINRAYSTDLVHWEEEGTMFDVRDVPTGGEARGDNGDQSFCHFKGKSYCFYTLNINSYGYGIQNIRYTVDNRLLDELMRIKP